MILYLDASALVKQYIRERGSEEVEMALTQAESIATAVISRAEVSAALAKAVRLGVLTPESGGTACQAFRSDWLTLVRVAVTELVVGRADAFAWDYGLRGYDAVHLAAASVWAETMGSRLLLATFDRDLWIAAQRLGMQAYPDDLPSLLDQWRAESV